MVISYEASVNSLVVPPGRILLFRFLSAYLDSFLIRLLDNRWRNLARQLVNCRGLEQVYWW
jgi:hypothetical protein